MNFVSCFFSSQSIQRNDVLVELDVDPGNPQFFRMSRVAWLNTRRK